MEIKGIRLDVKYEEKEKAKNAGARWDYDAKVWYLPVCSHLVKVSKWLNPQYILYFTEEETRKMALKEAGITHENVEKDKKRSTTPTIFRLYMEIREGYACHKCKNGMDILQPFAKPPKNPQHTKPYEYCLTWDKPKSYVDFANSLGIKMQYKSTATVHKPYALHICPHCGQIQGDFYIFEDKDCMLPVKRSFYVTYDKNQDIWKIEE